MSDAVNSGAEAVSSSAAASRSGAVSGPSVQPLLTRLYTHNPFYAISAVLMLFAIRNAYGRQEIGSINCWVLLGVLGGYTALMGLIGVLIVRWGKVWEDARSIFVVMLLLFLATSLSADDLFVKMESARGGLLLVAGGYLFAAALTEAVLRGAQIRLGWLYWLPYHLLLALFFLAPWWVSPELHPRSRSEMEWLIAAYPVVALVVMLTLIPAARRGAAYLSENGTPWPWPMFPWIGFGVLIFAHLLRAFAMCMTFGPRGPIWLPTSSGIERGFINFDTMWGPWFLVPMAFGVLVLVLEASLASGNVRLQRRVMLCVPVLLLLALPMSTGPVFSEFLERVTGMVAAPLWIALLATSAVYIRGWLANVPLAGTGLLSSVLLLSVIGPTTTGPSTMTTPVAWPWLFVGAVTLVAGLARSTVRQAIGGVLLTAGLWVILPGTSLAGFRNVISLHVLWAALLVVGLSRRDLLATMLTRVSAAMFPIAVLWALEGPARADLPAWWKAAYVSVLAIAAITIAVASRRRVYLWSLGGIGAIGGYDLAAYGFRGSASLFGKAAMTSFLWSFALLLVGLLISAHKARWFAGGMPWRRRGEQTTGTADSGS
ncbi:MAG TPA: hypothetical protein VM452_05525 [Caulifigura sp.]|nr:hypothetical protein [Caulifigura sp.]